MPRVPVLIDTDAGIDDALALSFAHRCADIDIVGLCAVGGVVTLQEAWRNLCSLHTLLELSPVLPLGRGLDQIDPHLADGRRRHGSNGLGDVRLPDVRRHPIDVLDLYRQLVDLHGRELVILALGPLTNIAAVHAAEPKLLRRIARLVVCGGSIYTTGTQANGASEFNFYRDPHAASDMTDWPVARTLVPLDVSRQVPVPDRWSRQLAAASWPGAPELARMLGYRQTRASEPRHGAAHLTASTNPSPTQSVSLPDLVAAAAVAYPDLFVETELLLDVRDDADSRGRVMSTQPLEDEPAIRVAISADMPKLLDRIEAAWEIAH